VEDFTVRNPIKVVDRDYQNDDLIFVFNHQPPPKWIEQFQHNLDITHFVGTGPESVRFLNSRAMIETRPQNAPSQFAHFKDWVEKR
jgi:hypothetical protein